MFILYLASLYIIFFLATKISDPKDRTGLNVLLQVILFVMFWPVLLFVVNTELVDSLKSRYNTRKLFRLEEKLQSHLKKSNSDKQKINQLITGIESIKICEIKRNERTGSLTYIVETIRDADTDTRTYLEDIKIGCHLFGDDYVFNKASYSNDGAPVVEGKQSLISKDTVLEEETTDYSKYDQPMVFRTKSLPPHGEPWLSVFTLEFKKSIAKLDKKLKGRIVDAIMEICDSPVDFRGDTQKPLVGELEGHWRYRIGDYRLVYFPMMEHHKIVFTNFDSRGQIYN